MDRCTITVTSVQNCYTRKTNNIVGKKLLGGIIPKYFSSTPSLVEDQRCSVEQFSFKTMMNSYLAIFVAVMVLFACVNSDEEEPTTEKIQDLRGTSQNDTSIDSDGLSKTTPQSGGEDIVLFLLDKIKLTFKLKETGASEEDINNETDVTAEPTDEGAS